MHTFCPTTVRTLKLHIIDHESRIEAAIIDLKSQERINYYATAKKWNLDRTTLARRHRGETGLYQDATSYARRQLIDI
jgi:hypothetical protein